MSFFALWVSSHPAADSKTLCLLDGLSSAESTMGSSLRAVAMTTSLFEVRIALRAALLVQTKLFILSIFDVS
jgi:hypothetical protein